MGRENDDSLEEIKEKLETQQNKEDYESKWVEAYDQWENEGDRSMLENLLQQQSQVHSINTLEKLRKKGRDFDYDKNDALLYGLLGTGLVFELHPLTASLVLMGGYKVLKDSINDLGDESNFWQRLDAFGLEMFYYITGVTLAAYYFIVLNNQSVAWMKAGSLIILLVEVVKLAGIQ